MAGQIIERGKGKHVVRVFLGRDAETGKRKYLNKTVAGTKKDAQKVLTALLRNKDLGQHAEVTRLTLKDYLEHCSRQAPNDLDLVFASEVGTPLNEQDVSNRHFKPTLERAGLPRSLRLYDLRHTHATLLLIAGTHPKIVSERLGHAMVTLTLDTYSHVLPGCKPIPPKSSTRCCSKPSPKCAHTTKSGLD